MSNLFLNLNRSSDGCCNGIDFSNAIGNIYRHFTSNIRNHDCGNSNGNALGNSNEPVNKSDDSPIRADVNTIGNCCTIVVTTRSVTCLDFVNDDSRIFGSVDDIITVTAGSSVSVNVKSDANIYLKIDA